MNIPIISLEVQGMKETIRHAFMERLVSQSEEIQTALDRICTPDNIQRIVDEAANEAIKAEISSFYNYGPGRNAVKAAVAEALDYRENMRKGVAS